MMREELEELKIYENYDPREPTLMELENMYSKYEFKDYKEILFQIGDLNGCYEY